MADKKYYISEEQLNILEKNNNNIGSLLHAITDMCKIEKPDIMYGFELGRLHTKLLECCVNLQDLEMNLRLQ